MTDMNTAFDTSGGTDHHFRTTMGQSMRWAPVFAGVVTAIGVQFVLTVLGLAIGVSASDAADLSNTSDAAPSIGVVAGAWWLISGAVSLAIGGMVLGRLLSWGSRMELRIHAVALWAVVAIFGFMVIWSGAGIASNVASPFAGVSARDSTSPSERDRLALQSPLERSVRAEDARRAAQAAAWWSVIGLLLGVTATIAGASFRHDRRPETLAKVTPVAAH